MMGLLRECNKDYVDLQGGDHEEYLFYCPGCKHEHRYIVKWGSNSGRTQPQWQFNGNMEKPTFTPSLLMRTPQGDKHAKICHLYLTDGVIKYLSDCTHELAGQNIPLGGKP